MERTNSLKSFIFLLLFLFFISTTLVQAEESLDETLEHQGQQFVKFMEDSVITAQAIAKIAMDKAVADVKVDITTEHGVVTLTGNVNSQMQANKIIELVSSTPGVKKVDATRLLVEKSKQPTEDWLITAKIRSLFLKEKLFGEDISALGISIETNNGVVFLSGTADNAQQTENAIALAKSVKGVVKVESDIRVVTKKSGS